ncbi:MAG: insulinase family protein [Oscillospiraceae bacterium]|nr:insulinase family protein [Oscillospiraceae bacterium]
MSVRRKQIAESIFLNIIETDKFKTNYISVNFITRLDKQTASLNALIPMVLKRGTKNFPNIAKISEKLEDLYDASLNERAYKRGENQIISFVSSSLNNKYSLDNTDILSTDILSGIIDMFAEIIFNHDEFKAEYVESEKNNLIDNIKAEINNKTAYAVTRCQEVMCENEVYGTSPFGKVEDVEKISVEQLFAQYKKLLCESIIEIYFVGTCDFDDLFKKMSNIFSYERKNIIKLNTNVIRSAEKIKEYTEDQPVTQGKLSLGFRTGSVLPDGDYFKFVLFNELYAGSPTSKLFMNVREKLSLCYYCRSVPEPIKGVMIVSSGIEVANKELAQSEILLQLENVKNGVITDEELSSAKNSIINKYQELSDSPALLESWYIGRMLAGLTDSPEKAIEQIKTVTIDDLIQIAKKITLDTIYFMNGTLKGGNENV